MASNISTLSKPEATNRTDISTTEKETECDAFLKNVNKERLKKPKVFEKLNSPSVFTFVYPPDHIPDDLKDKLYVDICSFEDKASRTANEFHSTFKDNQWIINNVYRKIKDCGYHASDVLALHVLKAYKYAKEHSVPFTVPNVIIEDHVYNTKVKQACEKMRKHNDIKKFHEDFTKTPLGKMEQHLTNACGLKIIERYPFTSDEGYLCVATHVEFCGVTQ